MRGAILHFHLGGDELKNPNLTSHTKWGVLLSHDCSGDPLYFAYFTTSLAFYKHGRLDGELIRLEPRDYPFIKASSVLPILELESHSRSVLREKYRHGLLKPQGSLKPEHLAELDRKARMSRQMEKRYKRIICPEGMAPPYTGSGD